MHCIPGGDTSLLLFFSIFRIMIDKKALADFIESKLKGTDLFLVELEVSNDGRIRVEIDSDTSVDIDTCVELTRAIEAEFDRDKEDYELEVGSSGLTSPLKNDRQYRKHIGKEVEVLTCDGRKLKGILAAATPDSFTLRVEEKVKKEGEKRPVIESRDINFGYGDVKHTKYLLKF